MVDVIGIDHLYLSVADMAISEAFYDRALIDVLGFRKNRFALGGEPHVQYYNRHFGFVLRPARVAQPHEPYAPGLHHFCLRVDGAAEVQSVAERLRAGGIEASAARLYPEYAADYCATYFTDPDGVRLEVTNYRDERRARHDHWQANAASVSPISTTRLAPMAPAAFGAYVGVAIAEYAVENVAAGRWPQATALARSRAEFETLLPQGLATPDNHLFEIRLGADDVADGAEGGPVIGALWFAIENRHGERSAFVYDILVHPPWRRQGHATRAFEALEALAQAHGATRIGLHVFGHNPGAQALYRKLGYGVTGLNMAKPLSGTAGDTAAPA